MFASCRERAVAALRINARNIVIIKILPKPSCFFFSFTRFAQNALMYCATLPTSEKLFRALKAEEV